MARGFRRGMTKQNVLSDLSQEEIARIKAQRAFDEIPVGSLTWKLALYNDSLRVQLRTTQVLVTKRLWNIQRAKAKILVLEAQLSSGSVTEKLADGSRMMTREEAEVDVVANEWLARGEAEAIPKLLAEIRSLVGHIDIAKNVILTAEDFEVYATKVLGQLRQFGYDVLAGIA